MEQRELGVDFDYSVFSGLYAHKHETWVLFNVVSSCVFSFPTTEFKLIDYS